jgi:hypothetical protein
VPNPDSPTDYQALVRQCRPTTKSPKTIEQQLDTLLELRQKREAQQGQPADEAEPTVLDQLRRQMRQDLIPAFEELRKKYEPSGIVMEMDAEDFLSGGVGLVIEVAFDIHGMRMEGTVTPKGIAFHEARFSNNVRGVLTTGPMLQTRNLTEEKFREFICERISQLVRSAMQHRRATQG